jgi:hypothetical protein
LPDGNGHKNIFNKKTWQAQAQGKSDNDLCRALGPSPEEVHSNLMLRHILSSSQDSSDGCNFRYSDALQAQLKVHYEEKDRDCGPIDNSPYQVSKDRDMDSRGSPQPSTGQFELEGEHAEGLEPDIKREDLR